MDAVDPTSWNELREAAGGDGSARAAFAARYATSVRETVERRWRGTWRASLVDDAVQEVFVECFKADGVLFSAAPDEGPGFRVYLAAVVRNVARRVEERASRDWARRASLTEAVDIDSGRAPSASSALDREWARALVLDAAAEQRRRALDISELAVLRADLLDLRFGEGLSIKSIEEAWGVDAAWVHHQFAKSKVEFQRALEAVIRGRHGEDGEPDLARRIQELVALLG